MLVRRSRRWRRGRDVLAALGLLSACACACGFDEAGDGALDAQSTAAVEGGDPWSACGAPRTYAPESDGSCGPGGVTFQLTGAPGVEWWINDNEGTNATTTNWLTLYSCDSQTQLLLTPTEDSTGRDCASCPDSWSVTLGRSSWKLPPAAGQTATWDGTYYVQGSCGAAQACVSPACAAPGRYVAEMCACAPSDETPGGCLQPVCVPSAFDYPAENSVAAVLPDSDR